MTARRMTERQTRHVRQLIRRQCANYDAGNCLLLDNGETCVCPQSITTALICRYFKEAVLPSDRELYAEVMGSVYNWRRCALCGSSFTPTGNRSIYCQKCAQARTRQRKASWARKNRVEHRRLGHKKP